MKKLTIELLIKEAQVFCMEESKKNHMELIGINDGKTIGTYIEHGFKNILLSKYNVSTGSSADGIDLPDNFINTDIKTTSIKQPQSSCPFKSSEQKIFGLGYNLLVFVYEKRDENNICYMKFLYSTFIEAERTADYTTTKMLINMFKNGAEKEDIVAFLEDIKLPVDEVGRSNIADLIINKKIKQGYLTISNALQWRLQYKKVINLKNSVDGIYNYEYQ